MGNSSLKNKALGWVGWSALNSWGTQLMQFATTLVLARMLTPADFGAVAAANTVTMLAATLNEFGVSSSLVQRKGVEERHLSSAFWANLAVGSFLTLLVWSCAGVVARFYGNARVEQVLSLLSLVFVIGSTKVVHGALLTRRLQFRKMALVSLSEMAVNGAVAIGSAWFFDQGVWSLVYGRIAGVTVGSLLTMAASGWRPRLVYDGASFRELFRFGMYAMGVNFVTFFITNLDNIMVGRFSGVAALGIYSMAYNIVTLPQKKISSMVSGVAFPVLSRMQEDRERVAQAYQKILSLLSFVTFPLLGGLAVVAPEFVAVALGAKWADAVVPLQILCFAGMLRAVGTTVGSIFFSQGRPDLEFRLDVASLVALCFALRFGAVYGVTGISVAVCCHYLVMQLFYFFAVGKIIGRTLAQLYKPIVVNLGYVCLMALCVFGVKTGATALTDNKAILLVVSVAVGGACYAVLCVSFNKTLLAECRNLLQTGSAPTRAAKGGVDVLPGEAS